MKVSRTDHLAISLLVAVLIALLSGCSVTIGTSPDAYPFPSEKVFSVRPDVAANIANFYTEPEKVELASRVYCDLQHFTATAVAMVRRELEVKGVAMSPDAEKTVVLKVVYPSWVRGMWTMRGRVTLQAALGNGEQVTIDADYQTGGNAMRAFNGSILRAVTGLLEDEVFAAYVNE
jgi:hypothetical protein